jgi:propanediol utilization protein
MGARPTQLASHAIHTIVSPDEDWVEGADGKPNVFQTLGLLRSVAQMAISSAGTDRVDIARPAREARDILKTWDEESLAGLF